MSAPKVDTVMEKADAVQAILNQALKAENRAVFDENIVAAEAALLALEAAMQDPEMVANPIPGVARARAELVERMKNYFTAMFQEAKARGATLPGPPTPPAAGGKRRASRKMSRKYCKKTTCKKMGFSQKASCRPYKNCLTRRARRKGY